MHRCIVFGLAGVSLLTSGLAFAADRYDPFKGKELARQLCASCHVVDSQQQEASVDVPTFNEIANKDGQTTGGIIAQIMLPAHPQPNIPLTQDELSDLAAYILSMRKSG